MTRKELIDQIYHPWIPGDVIQGRPLGGVRKWKDFVIPFDNDPITSNREFHIDTIEYRIKPRVTKYTFELRNDFNPKQLAASLHDGGYNSKIVEAIRNAKLVKE